VGCRRKKNLEENLIFLYFFFEREERESMLTVVLRRRALSTQVISAARGRIEENRVYETTPFLPAKIQASRIKPAIRKELNQLDKELSEVKMNIVKMENLGINEMLNRELQIHCGTVLKEKEPDSTKTVDSSFEPIEDIKYFYFWTVEGHFFALLETCNQIKEADCSKYPLPGLDEFDGVQERISHTLNNYQYNRAIMRAKWNYQTDANSTFFGSYFDNILIRISSIWISQASGIIFLHFCPTFRISLVLQLSIESSQICSVLADGEPDHPTPFISNNKNIFLIKVPLSKTSDLKFYAKVKSDVIGEEYHRDVWRLNPVTSVIVDSVHPD